MVAELPYHSTEVLWSAYKLGHHDAVLQILCAHHSGRYIGQVVLISSSALEQAVQAALGALVRDAAIWHMPLAGILLALWLQCCTGCNGIRMTLEGICWRGF